MPDVSLDRAVIGTLMLLGADTPGFMDEIVADFAAAVAKNTVRLRAAARCDDREALAFAAHSLRGSCGIIGARRMARLSATLEEQGAVLSVDDTAVLIDALDDEYRAAREALDAALAGSAERTAA